MSIFKMGLWSQDSLQERLLPEGYTQLEYIESTGTQYIDTGINSDSTLKLAMDLQFTSGGPSSYQNPIGSIINGGGTRFHINPNSTSVEIQAGSNGYAYIFSGYPYTTRFQSIVDTPNKKIETRVSNTTQSANMPYTNPFDLNINFWLFRRNGDADGLKYYSYLKLYYFKMYQNDTLVRDFVPAQKSSDSSIGLYDRINDVFYTNAGTGTFTAGPKVSNQNITVKIYKDDNRIEAANFIEI